MDVNGSEWNDEQMVVRMWVGYIWRGQGVWCYHGYKTIYTWYWHLLLQYHMTVYVSIQQNEHIPCFGNLCMKLLICLKVRGQGGTGDS